MAGTTRALPTRLRSPFSGAAIVLWAATTALDLLSPVLGSFAVRAAFLDCALGLAVALGALLLRRLDYGRVPADSPLHRAVMLHASLSAAAFVLVVAGLWQRAVSLDAARTPVPALVAGAAALALLAIAERTSTSAMRDLVVVPLARRRIV